MSGPSWEWIGGGTIVCLLVVLWWQVRQLIAADQAHTTCIHKLAQRLEAEFVRKPELDAKLTRLESAIDARLARMEGKLDLIHEALGKKVGRDECYAVHERIVSNHRNHD